MDQYIGPYQNGDQAVQNSSAKVRLPSRTAQNDRAVYRLDPLTSGMELRQVRVLKTDLTKPVRVLPNHLDKPKPTAEPDLTWIAKPDLSWIVPDLTWIVRFPKMIETSLYWSG